ncbi:MAG TPA: ABC transporter ATP-binding protein [Sulfurospirillum arcachonense]|nr:ABC transporter ATP-binding protein [Sulfurospirillum arcachonense]HIP44292.1 ABC transporter ATP-binding protein [Sulfurospirillum arcachonense]
MIEVSNLTKKFGSTISLDSVSVSFKEGDHVALMGPNGAGKTTLIRLILGHYNPDSGKVLIDGLNPIKNRVEVLQHISFVPQLPPPIKLSLDELINYVVVSSGVKKQDIYHYAKEMELELIPNLTKSFFKLSGGMKQKLLIAISLAKKSGITIYDEPTANLDPKARENFYRLLQDGRTEKISLFVTHRIDELKKIINRQIYMDLGKIVSDEQV